MQIKALRGTIFASRPNGRVLTARFFSRVAASLRAFVIRGKPDLTEVVGFIEDRADVALQDIVEQTVAGLGYELVEIERSAGGLLRITIDMPWKPGAQQFVNVEDCEKVTRQLQFALEVEGTEYKRLEVSSPGIDRPLRGEQDFERFAGEVVDITLKAPIGRGGRTARWPPTARSFAARLERAAGRRLADRLERRAGRPSRAAR